MGGAGVQALVSRLLVAQVGGAVPVQGALLMHEQWCLWSSLDRADTASLVRLASLALLPAAHAAEQPSLSSRITSTLRSGPPPTDLQCNCMQMQVCVEFGRQLASYPVCIVVMEAADFG